MSEGDSAVEAQVGRESDPPGVIQMVMWPDGRVLATVQDFERSGYGGFSLLEAQRIRCRRRIGRAVVDALGHEILGMCLDEHDLRHMLDRMTSLHGYRVHEVVVGHPQEDR